MKTVIQALANFADNLRFEAIPSETVDMTKKCIFDSVGNMIYGRYSEMGAIALNYIQSYSQITQGDTDVFSFGGEKVSKDDALMVHAVMARCSDLDDGHRFAMGHPGSVIIPTALTMGELKGKNQEDILTAIVVGYDIYCRIGEVINPSSYRERGFDATGVCGAVACSAVIAKLSDFDEVKIKNALGLAAIFTSGLIEYQNDGTMGKILCGCFAIRNALQATQMADVGFTGPAKAFEGAKGFFQAFSNSYNAENVLKGLGEHFKINETYFKVHACMRGLHAAVDAVIDLRNDENISRENVERIEILTSPFVARLSNPNPQTPIAAQCSLEFVVAVALSLGKITEEKILTEALDVPEYLELANRVKLILDDEVDAYVKQNASHWAAVKVVAYTKNGARFERWMPLPRGEQESPFDWNQLSDKFVNLIEKTPYESYSQDLLALVNKFEDAENLWEDLYTPWKKSSCV
ncbi:MmgE/PrpD family protein [Geosporobacter ferrireducens]|uniref:MmgE/PrpD family protein n=1 Tax=Geosporobacter ferrireducens TaxID=1424294 RepID=UPI00139E8557|nr:MmgE/PrpD family protein [Geosporobacter ferrireducens]MTI56609.1 MmgE/PrpD family protein [Geosporobacter ferrireducens]